MAKQPRLARDHTLSKEQWDQLDADNEKAEEAAAEEAKQAPAPESPTEAAKPETTDGT